MPNIEKSKKRIRKLQEEKMENFVLREKERNERRKLSQEKNHIQNENESEDVFENNQKSNSDRKNRKLKDRKKTGNNVENSMENNFENTEEKLRIKDENHVRRYLLEKETEKIKIEEKRINDKKLRDSVKDKNFKKFDRNLKGRKLNDVDKEAAKEVEKEVENETAKVHEEVEKEILIENKEEDGGVHLSDGTTFIFIASDNELVKEAFAKYIKTHYPKIKGMEKKLYRSFLHICISVHLIFEYFS